VERATRACWSRSWRIDELTLDTIHESGGMEPLREGFKEVQESEKRLERAAAATGRVVNGWFSEGDRDVDPAQSLAAGAEYRYNLNIGRPRPQSHVERPVVIPEEQLEPFYEDGGLELRVILFSDDFEIPEPEQPLRLPRPPQASRIASFTVRAPSRPGRVRLRAGVYFRQNLLQSLLVTAEVTSRAETREHGNEARVDFALMGNLRDVERYPERTLNIVANDSGDGTHAFAVVGTDLKWSLTLKEGPMRKAVQAARRRLEDVCATRDREGKPDKYRFRDPTARLRDPSPRPWAAIRSDRQAIARAGKVNPRLEKLPGAAEWPARGSVPVAGESGSAPRLPKYVSRDSAKANPGRFDYSGTRVRYFEPRNTHISSPARHFGPDLSSRSREIGISRLDLPRPPGEKGISRRGEGKSGPPLTCRACKAGIAGRPSAGHLLKLHI
jgi:hypothetical protein